MSEPILPINIHNAVLYFKGSFVAGFIMVQKCQHDEHLLPVLFLRAACVSHESSGRSRMLAATIGFFV